MSDMQELEKQRPDGSGQRADTDGAERDGSFTTTSGRPIERLYGPTDVAELDYDRDLGQPGEYPFTNFE